MRGGGKTIIMGQNTPPSTPFRRAIPAEINSGTIQFALNRIVNTFAVTQYRTHTVHDRDNGWESPVEAEK
ncbi:unnamed protein product [Nippostrongylus brasiliensis]|uniref:Catalase n=1 Tax=Nippostrongylus brasiliensis TaxID=27835 RepID=A0A0N4YQR7_NIPBR|nr:unnamed protein product [Nippostrongylus brasiliensis]